MDSISRLLIGISLVATLALPVGASAETVATNTGPSTTKTEILAGKNVGPMLSASSSLALRQAEEHYGVIAANGGWPKVTKSGLKKGTQSEAVAVLNRRLFIEGYLRVEATQGEYAPVFTTATQDAVARFQRNHGLAITGIVDAVTLAALNVPAKERLRTIRENIPRLEIYEGNLGDRYLVVNVPAQQIETVQNGRVYSRHNAIVGRPERPTPVVMTALSQVKFNPYWNAPASIVERDIFPKLRQSTRILQEMDIKIFEGVGGPEVDPRSVDWDRAIADNYHFRQEPGPGNAMATAKIEFDSPFGIYLHDTPERQLFKTGKRFYSSGCVRVDRMDVMLNWVLNGQDGFGEANIAALAETLERLDVPLTVPPQLRVVYLTAWPVGNTVAFRPDIYDLDGTEFTVGQPMPLGEMSPEGLRYTLKPIPRLVAQVDAGSEGGGLFGGLFKSSKKRSGGNTVFTNASSASAKGKKSADFFDVASDTERDSATTKPDSSKAKKKSVGLFDWATYRKEQQKKKAEEAAAAKLKPSKEKSATADAKPAAVAKKKVTEADVKKIAAKKTEPKKAASGTEVAAKADAAAKKPAAGKSAPAAKAESAKPAPKVDCKPDKDNKMPAGCKVTSKSKSAVSKPAVKPAASTATN